MASTKLTAREQERVAILTAAIEGKTTNGQAAKQLRLSVRQVQRAKAVIRHQGETGIVHKLKGKPSNHRVHKKHYSDFKPAFATEKLQERHKIAISSQTTRRWMNEAGLWKIRGRKKTTYRSWRPRKEYFGELQQFDGSYHLWFENRFVDEHGNPIEVCLLAAIDDATGKITKAVFAANEGVIAVFTFWKEYIEKHGKPLGIYLDKFSTYKINHKAAVDNAELMTQFQRVLQTLSIEQVIANSPEAKGRVERLFQTLQDRLVKEMRLAKINTPEDGNKFLQKVFIPQFNKKFAVTPTKDGTVHRPLQAGEKKNLHHIFSVHKKRRVNNDFTVQFNTKWYQLTEIQPTTVRPREEVVMETWLDGSVHIILRDRELNYFLLPEKPQKQIQQPTILTSHTLAYKPPPDHPWRKFKLGKG
jgi:Helix-turn-helix domain